MEKLGLQEVGMAVSYGSHVCPCFLILVLIQASFLICIELISANFLPLSRQNAKQLMDIPSQVTDLK